LLSSTPESTPGAADDDDDGADGAIDGDDDDGDDDDGGGGANDAEARIALDSTDTSSASSTLDAGCTRTLNVALIVRDFAELPRRDRVFNCATLV
jgi:hypothetical protein